MAKEDPSSKSVQRKNAAADYGWSIAVMNSDPDLKKIFKEAVDNTWDPARFVAEVQGTKWFKTHSDSARAALIQQTVDPKTWQKTLNANNKALQDSAAEMGAVLSSSQLNKMVHDMTVLGWNDAQQKNALASYVQVASSGPMKGQYLGTAGVNAQQLRQTAADNGYKISDQDLSKWNKSIAAGDSSVADYQQFMRRQAALTFPSFADELYAGSDMKSIANPYITAMSQTLEIPSDQIDLFDPTIRKALASKDPKSGKPTAMAMYDFENSLRQDARWQRTDNAKQDAANLVLNIGRTMGVA